MPVAAGADHRVQLPHGRSQQLAGTAEGRVLRSERRVVDARRNPETTPTRPTDRPTGRPATRRAGAGVAPSLRACDSATGPRLRCRRTARAARTPAAPPVATARKEESRTLPLRAASWSSFSCIIMSFVKLLPRDRMVRGPRTRRASSSATAAHASGGGATLVGVLSSAVSWSVRILGGGSRWRLDVYTGRRLLAPSPGSARVAKFGSSAWGRLSSSWGRSLRLAAPTASTPSRCHHHANASSLRGD